MKRALEGTLRHVLPITTGRINPLHLAHQDHVFTPLLNSSKNNIFTTESGLVPCVFIMGSSGDDRNVINNPFSYDQRVDMALIAFEEIYRTKLWHSLPQEFQYQLCTTPIRSLLDLNATFPKHTDNKERNNPPKLDSLADFITDHCQKHGLPMDNLFFRATVKPGELGREYQLNGQRYYDCHQMIAVAQNFGAQYQQDLIEDVPDRKIVSATQIRHNLAENFTSLSPRVFLYVQKELAQALLNNRPIGKRLEAEEVTQTDSFCRDLARKDQMLTFDGASAKVSTVPMDLIDRFHAYIIRAEQPYRTSVSKGAQALDTDKTKGSITK